MHVEIGSRWVRRVRGEYIKESNGYTVIAITNTAHKNEFHQPDVIYQGDNGNLWSLPWRRWPGNLVLERDKKTKPFKKVDNYNCGDCPEWDGSYLCPGYKGGLCEETTSDSDRIIPAKEL